MKHRAVFALLIAMAGLALLVGCMPNSLQGIAGKSSTGGNPLSCTDCHSGETVSTYGQKVLAAKAQYYEGSGHYNGPRLLEPTGEYVNEGSNSMYCNGGGCSQCHTDQGFVSFTGGGGWKSDGTLLGTSANLGAASQPGCFTCHEPHETGDFTLRSQVPVTLIDQATIFDGGKGNLCVSCHKARTAPIAVATPAASAGITATNTANVAGFVALINGGISYTYTNAKAPTVLQRWSSSSGPHHGPQADFMKGVDNWRYGTNTDYVASSHLTATDSCVTCHMYEPASRLGGNLSLGGHGTYLNSAVHGSPVELVAQCQTCHKIGGGGTGAAWPGTVTATTFQKSGHTVALDIDGVGGAQDILVEIDGLKKKLLAYFGNSANFLDITYTLTLDGNLKITNYGSYTISTAGAGHAPVTDLIGADYNPGTSYEFNKDWVFNGSAVPAGVTSALMYPVLNKWQSQSFWNFKLFMEDKSRGIHNPTFAARILYDALKNLQDNGVAGITLGTRP